MADVFISYARSTVDCAEALIAINGDPLTDIRTLEQVQGLVKEGKLVR